jgi:hypothetical protein
MSSIGRRGALLAHRGTCLRTPLSSNIIEMVRLSASQGPRRGSFRASSGVLSSGSCAQSEAALSLDRPAKGFVALQRGEMSIRDVLVGVGRVEVAAKTPPGVSSASARVSVADILVRMTEGPGGIAEALRDLPLPVDVLGIRPLAVHNDQDAEATLPHDHSRLETHRRGVDGALRVGDRACLADDFRTGRLRFLRGRGDGPMSPYILPVVVALLATVLLGGLVLGHFWQQHEHRNVEKKWQERERLLDRRRPVASRREILRRRVRPRRSASLARGPQSGRR